jgi:cell division protein FtsL
VFYIDPDPCIGNKTAGKRLRCVKTVDSNMTQEEGRHGERLNADGMASPHYFQRLFKQKGDPIMLINIQKRRRAFFDQLRMYRLNITIMATMLLIFVFLGATSYLYMHSETALNTQKEQREYFEQKATDSEWMRINRKHGYPPVVIKGEEETPYFYDNEGRKCLFI